MQRYSKRFGLKYQDVTLLNSEEEMRAFAEELSTAASQLAVTDKAMAHTVGRASRLLDIIIAHGVLVPRHLLLPNQHGYAQFMQDSATEEEIRREQRYRHLLGSARQKGFARVPGADPT